MFGQAEQLQLQSLGRFESAEVGDFFVGRTGYTGEDGFEIMMPNDRAIRYWQQLIESGVKPCGLGARDTLRLEAGMNLYGTDMDATTSPIPENIPNKVAMSIKLSLPDFNVSRHGIDVIKL